MTTISVEAPELCEGDHGDTVHSPGVAAEDGDGGMGMGRSDCPHY